MIDQKFHRAQDGGLAGPAEDDGQNPLFTAPDSASALSNSDGSAPAILDPGLGWLIEPMDRGVRGDGSPLHGHAAALQASTAHVAAAAPLAEDASSPFTSVTSNQAAAADASGTPITSDVSPSMNDEITFLTGVTNTGTVAPISFQTWNGDGADSSAPDTSATYNSTTSNAQKWAPGGPSAPPSAPGTTGGTQLYYFDPGSNWTPTEMTALESDLALWSAVANIQFAETSDPSLASITFHRATDGATTTQYPYASGEFEFGPNGGNDPIGSSTLANGGAGAYLQIETQGFEPLGNFNGDGSGVTGPVHELGHFLGLGHGGPYNGSVNTAAQQYSAYDNQLYSVMSYIPPSDTTAKYYPQYALQNANFDGKTPTTWMPLDILAVQRLYGAPTAASPLSSGGQVFGYHDNITGLLHPFFDFSAITQPVVTLYDTGSNNTLDLSGDSSVETIDLNAGDYSSFAGLSDNLTIAFGTAIDNFVGGTDGETITTNTDSDILVGGIGGTNTAVFSGALAKYTLSQANGVETVVNNSTSAVDKLTNFQTMQFSDQSVQITACYAEGTRIATPTGETPIEELAVGDLVLTASGDARAVRWLGHRATDISRQPDPSMFWPIIVKADAFAPGVPSRDLALSPEHKIADQGVLIPVYLLQNDCTILQRRCDAIVYWHVELDTHDVIVADGLPAETYLDTGNRAAFVNGDAFMALHPDFRTHGNADTCMPLVLDGPSLAAVKAALLVRVAEFGHTLTDKDEVHVLADGKRIEPVRLGENRAAFMLPAGCANISLRSRVFIPAHASADRCDGRSLGVYLERLQIDGEDVALEDETVCAEGWHGFEEHEGRRGRRWTTGTTPLPANSRLVMIDFAGRGTYWSRVRNGNVVTLFG